MARVIKTDHEDIVRVERAWGHELWIENMDLYCGKLLFIKKGHAGSMHYHMKKTETMYLQSGCVEIQLIDPEVGQRYKQDLFPGERILLRPGQAHRISAREDSELFEFSTMHYEDDSYRVSPGMVWVDED